jgi:hypothetical protein
MVDPYDKQKEGAGRYATFAWLGSCVWLFVVDGSHGTLLTWKALGFFLVGMFAAALLIGGAIYIVQRAASKLLMVVIKEPSSGAAAVIITLGLLVYAAWGVGIFCLARWLYRLS